MKEAIGMAMVKWMSVVLSGLTMIATTKREDSNGRNGRSIDDIRLPLTCLGTSYRC